METEIELKFFVSPEFSDVLLAKISENKVLQHSRRELGNLYFDTADTWLRQHDIGLRIRRFDDVYVQTVKTAGRVVAGLHQRPEYNAEHDSDVPKLSLHPDDIWPVGKSIDDLQAELAPLFETNFTREQWLVAMPDGSQIEVAFDQGQVIAKDQCDPICEVELELRSGQTEALFTLARALSEGGGMRLGNLSKAARGYRLAFGYPGDKTYELDVVDVDADDSVELSFIQSLEHALAHWQYHEQVYLDQRDVSALHQVLHALTFIRQIFSTYGNRVPRRASVLLRQEVKWLEDELNWVEQHAQLSALLDDKGHKLRKLDGRKVLLPLLNERFETLPTEGEVVQLLTSGRYTGLLLDLSRWVLSRGWQPFLDDKAKEKMNRPVTEYSQKQLQKLWLELQETFADDKPLSAQAYIDQKYRLQRHLYTGFSFANLYDSEERNSFRLPWADLIHGIDDLLLLEQVEYFKAHLHGDEKEQLERWLTRKQSSILHAMEQTLCMAKSAQPYWQ